MLTEEAVDDVVSPYHSNAVKPLETEVKGTEQTTLDVGGDKPIANYADGLPSQHVSFVTLHSLVTIN